MSKQRSHRGRSPERKAWSAAKDPRALVLRTLYDTAVRCMRREECDEQSEPSVEDVDKENQILPEELDKENGRFLEANEQQEVVKDDDKAKNDEMAIFFSRSGPYETSASDKSKRGKVRKFADLERDADIGWEWQPGPGGEILFPRAATPEPEPERPAKRLRLSSSHRALRTISMLPKESQDIEMPGIMGLNGFVVDTTRVFGDDAVDIDFNFDVDNDVYGGGVSAAEACRSPDVPPASVEGSTLTRARRGRAPLATTFLEA
ncbi:hypothetical protein BD626DRAFT_496675 [Schizophyllum amplum]|uniref:Uncharacterized protein n=1 Tax=Schizophyllum amplum TaxID=97359 RepID=A0A550CDS4_9AGAR|nr:hypothetical protein BD626DRAFT_496675 [Auriculariopsis ampla]